MISKVDLGKTALVYRDEKVTYQELFNQIDRYSQLFKDKDYDKVAIYSENRLEWIYGFYSAWKNDCTAVTVDFLSTPDDVAYILNDCKPGLIYVSQDLKEKLNSILDKIDYHLDVIVFEEVQLPEVSEDVLFGLPEDKEETAVIIYTSGTTGSPKGVMLSYNNLLANVDAVANKVKIFTKERQALILLPMHHILPLAGSMLAPLFIGGTAVISPSMQSSDILETLKNNSVNIMIGVPRLYELLYKGIKAKIDAKLIGRIFFGIAKLLKSKKFSKKIFNQVHVSFGGSMEYFVCGGAALNTTVGSFFETLGIDVLEGFGMTEAAPMITFPRPGKVKLGTTGQALPGLELKLQDGEILAKGPNIMKGYYNRPEETADVLKDGWLYTGDLGTIDKQGYLRITGRKKEIIVLPNGKNINPVELESKMELNVAFVNEVGVFLNNDLLHAIIVPNYDELANAEIKDPEKYFKETGMPEFNEKLSSYKRIMKFSLVKNEIPRTRLGKIQRYKLAELIDKPAKKQQKQKDPDTEEYRAVKSFIESQVDMTISPDDHLEFDIAMDSLGKISLLEFIERTFGVKIEESKLLKFPSIKQMVEHIREHKLFHNTEKPNWSQILKEKINFKVPEAWPTQQLINKSAKGIFKLYFKFNVKGLSNVPEGPCIIAPNHQSFFDGLFVTSFFKRKTMKDTFFYAKRKHVKSGFMKLMARKNNVIVMDLNKDLKESIQKLAEILKQGKKLIIFPEGTRTANGKMGDFKKTFAILSKELNVPVIPVAIAGAYNAMPTGKKIPKMFSPISVDFLKPVYPQLHTFESLTKNVKETIANKLG